MDLENNKKEYIAHVRKDEARQSVEEHLADVGEIAWTFYRINRE